MLIARRVQRRTFLRGGITLGGALAFPFLFARRARAVAPRPLVPDPAGRLDLPEGFSYTVLDQGGQTMSDGYRVPGNPDGMGCFPGPAGTIVLLRNHELMVSSRGPYLASQTPPPEAYDANMVGGVTRLVLDAATKARVSSNLVLVGTAQNCAGGPSPWGWLSCEENVDGAHGYTFVCPVDAARVTSPQRIVGYGHFRHEAVAIDPAGNIAYLTEDRPNSALYRFVPDSPAAPFTGTLQALRIRGRDAFDTSTGLSVGDELEVDWIDLADPNPVNDTLRATARASGAAIVSRGEGIWFERGVVYFTATDGGPIDSGQVFALRPTASGGTLTLIAQSDDPAVLDGPDNICMAPWGNLVIAEDGFDGNSFYLRFLTPSGAIVNFGRTELSELAGVCFSPDGRCLFVNIFGADVTLAVTGPFPASDPDGGTGGSGGSGGTDGPGGQGGDGDGAGAPNGGQAGEATGGASDRGGGSSAGRSGGGVGGSTGGSGDSGSAAGGNGGSGLRAGAGSGGAGTEGSRPRASDSRDDPGCGCEIPGRRR